MLLILNIKIHNRCYTQSVKCGLNLFSFAIRLLFNEICCRLTSFNFLNLFLVHVYYAQKRSVGGSLKFKKLTICSNLSFRFFFLFFCVLRLHCFSALKSETTKLNFISQFLMFILYKKKKVYVQYPKQQFNYE